MPTSREFACYKVRQDAQGRVSGRVESINVEDLPPGEVLISVAYSSLNYKDALACQGNPGIVTSFPHVPGIDCAGTVVESASGEYQVGDDVLVTGYELGAPRWGGFAEFVRVPAEWVVPMPNGLTAREAMSYGTAGFTSAQCVAAIVDRGIEPARGPVLVTGATGGVGSLAVAILAKLGYEVHAVTGKRDLHEWLARIGARTILDRGDLVDQSERALLSARWAAAVDTVGGETLSTIVRSLSHRGCVAACGLVGGTDLHLTVYPFLLRGITLAGIDSAKCPRRERLEIWRRLSTDWRIDGLDEIASEITLDELPTYVERILSGQVVGRTLVVPRSAAPAN